MLAAVLAPAAPARASHDDGTFDLPTFVVWNRTVFDVLIVPPPHGQLVNRNGALNGGDVREATPFNSYLKAIEDSIADWNRGVSEFGSASLKSRFVTNVYVLGRDQVPPAALQQPEIVITTDETKGPVLGVAIRTRPCIVDNSMFFAGSFTYEDMFNVNSQEYGHCFGIQHVEGRHPEHDAMNGSYPHFAGLEDADLHCVSNLDILALDLSLSGTLGPATELPVFGYGGDAVATMRVQDYRTTGCG